MPPAEAAQAPFGARLPGTTDQVRMLRDDANGGILFWADSALAPGWADALFRPENLTPYEVRVYNEAQRSWDQVVADLWPF